MITPIAPAAATQPTTKPETTPSPTPQPSPQTKARPTSTDTVKISAAAAQQQELTETSAQTVREASHGDQQARNLLARQAANKKSGS